MNLFADFLNFPTPPVPPTPSYPTGLSLTDPIYILNAWQTLNQQYLDAKGFINDLTAKLSALETAQSNGTLDRFAASRMVAGLPGNAEIILQHAALSYIGTSGPLLLTAATALYLTPVQTALTNFNTTYQTVLHAKGLI